MQKNIPAGTEIQGAEILSNDCYYNANNELIIPNGAYLRAVFRQMPYGRINKKVPGIGATTLELESRRNSIIVVPSQYLADAKSITPRFYVGGAIPPTRKRPTDSQLEAYISNEFNDRKKLVVVADSLPRVMRLIGKDLKGWFIMLDEIDSFQEQSTFRSSLEIALDYYLMFDPEQRCMVSATLKEFSNKELQNDAPLTVNYPSHKTRTIKIINTRNVNMVCKYTIQSKFDILSKDEKIVIAYNSIEDAVRISHELREIGVSDCKILCSKYNADKAKPYFEQLEAGILPAKINFITSSYFAGIDFYDKYHLIHVASINKPHTLLSVDKTYQIYGRSRIKKDDTNKDQNNVLSETLINDAYEKNQSKYTRDTSYLIKKAHAQLQAFKCSEKALEAYTDDIDKMKELHLEMSEKLGYMRFSLLRLNKDEAVDISYFNIDSMIEFQKTRNDMYNSRDTVISSFEDEGHRINQKDWLEVESHKKQYPDDVQVNEKKKPVKKGVIESRKLALSNIASNKNIDELLKISDGEEKKFYSFYKHLCSYIEPDQLLKYLLEHTKISIGRIRLHRFERSVIFMSLNEEDMRKKIIVYTLTVGEEYTNDEILRKIEFMNNVEPTRGIFGVIKNSGSALRAIKPFVSTKEIGNRKKKEITKNRILDYNPFKIKLREGLSTETKEINVEFNKFY